MVVSVAHDGKRGIELVEELLPDLVLLDVMLPDTDGYDVCLRIKSNTATSPIPVIFLSARGEVVDKVRGLSCGAADYITKPFQAAELLARIDAVLGQARIVLASAIGSHDRPSAGHGERVASRAVQIGRALGLDESTRMTIRLGALLRDVGNARLPAAILTKSGELSPEERAMLERHPILGEEILSGFKRLSGLLPIVRHHHERLDGTGYPDALRAEQIPLEVRLLSVADRFEALLSDRADRPAVSKAEAVRILQSAVARGELDAAVVAALATQVRSSGAR